MNDADKLKLARGEIAGWKQAALDAQRETRNLERTVALVQKAADEAAAAHARDLAAAHEDADDAWRLADSVKESAEQAGDAANAEAAELTNDIYDLKIAVRDLRMDLVKARSHTNVIIDRAVGLHGSRWAAKHGFVPLDVDA